MTDSLRELTEKTANYIYATVKSGIWKSDPDYMQLQRIVLPIADALRQAYQQGKTERYEEGWNAGLEKAAEIMHPDLCQCMMTAPARLCLTIKAIRALKLKAFDEGKEKV